MPFYGTISGGGGGGGTPGGSDGAVQYRDGSAFGGFGFYDDVNGFFGIGTNTPDAMLHTYDSGVHNYDVPQWIMSAVAGFGHPNSGMSWSMQNTDGTELSRIQLRTVYEHDSGNPGTFALDFLVRNEASLNKLFSIDATDSLVKVYNGTDYQLRMGNESGGGATYVYDIGRNNSNGILAFYGYQTSNTGYSFGGVDGEWMRIGPNGYVGVGTASPSGHFTIQGDGSYNSGFAIQTGGGYPVWMTKGGDDAMYFGYGNPSAQSELARINASGVVMAGTAVQARGSASPGSGGGFELHRVNIGGLGDCAYGVGYIRDSTAYMNMVLDSYNFYLFHSGSAWTSTNFLKTDGSGMLVDGGYAPYNGGNLDTDVTNLGYIKSSALSGYELSANLDTDVGNLGYIKSANLASAVSGLGYELNANLDSDVGTLGYIKSSALSGYQTSSSLDTDVGNLGYIKGGVVTGTTLTFDATNSGSVTSLTFNNNGQITNYTTL